MTNDRHAEHAWHLQHQAPAQPASWLKASTCKRTPPTLAARILKALGVRHG